MNQAIRDYGDIGLESEILAASPHRLIQILFENALIQIQLSKKSIAEHDEQARVKSLKKCMNIITYLRETINMQEEQAKELANSLDKSYELIGKHVIYAALTGDTEYLDRAYQALEILKSAWDAIVNEVK